MTTENVCVLNSLNFPFGSQGDVNYKVKDPNYKVKDPNKLSTF